MNKMFTGIAVFMAALLGVGYVAGPASKIATQNQPWQPQQQQQQPLAPQQPRKPAISVTRPAYQNYNQIVEQLKQWNREAPDFTEVGVYGRSSRGQDLYYLRIYNRVSNPTGQRPKVLITACIHGNEPLSTSTTMWYIGTMLGSYGQDQDVTDLLNTRDIYFVPVVSPDSFPNARHVDGVDPNRDFPGPHNWNHQSRPPVKAICDLMLKHRFQAVISGHTHGRIFLTPYGDQRNVCPNQADYQRVVGKMGQMSGYRVDRACNMYGHPIKGTEVDWYYRHGAFAIVMEFGTHQRIPSNQDIQIEFDKTYRAVMHFVREAPLVQVQRQK